MKRKSNEEQEFRRLIEQAARLSHSDANGVWRSDIWREGIDHLGRMKIGTGPVQFSGFGGGGPGTASLVGAQWTQIGPAPLRQTLPSGPVPMAGRVYDIAIDPGGASDQKIYIATVGGIWKSTDAGATWAPKTDRLSWNQMGAVVIDPGNPSTIYAGGIFGPGPSLFRSIDGGETWSTIGGTAMNARIVTRIVIPGPGVVLVATYDGLYRSIDGGVSFGNNAPLYNNNIAVIAGKTWDLHLDTATPTKVYACVNGQGVFVSADGGATFPTNLFANPGAPAPGMYSCVTMTQSTQPDGKTLYASVADSGLATYLGLYKSVDTGSNWKIQPGAAPAAAPPSGQFGFNQTIGVDPQDASRLYLGFEDLWLSTDGATSFGVIPVTQGKVHQDHHAIAFSPKSHWGPAPTRLYVGTDGGFATSNNAGSTWKNLNEGGMATLMVLGFDIGRRSTANSRYSYTGSQDNGTSVRRPGLPGTDWAFGLGTDGANVAVDPSNPLNAYGSANHTYLHTGDAGMNWAPGVNLPASVGALAVDPHNGKRVYAAGGSKGAWPPQLLQSTDTGASFSLIHTFASGIMCIAIDPSASNTVWVGLFDGTVWRTDNALLGVASTWNPYSTGLPNGRGVTSLAVDPFNSKRVVAGYWGFSGVAAPNRSQHVYLTSDKGAKWIDASGTDGGPVESNLADRPVLAVALDPGSTNGLFGVTWSGSLLVVVGLDGTVLTSADGVNYTAQAPNAYNTLVDVIWTGKRFVAVGLGGTIMTSPDGILLFFWFCGCPRARR